MHQVIQVSCSLLASALPVASWQSMRSRHAPMRYGNHSRPQQPSCPFRLAHPFGDACSIKVCRALFASVQCSCSHLQTWLCAISRRWTGPEDVWACKLWELDQPSGLSKACLCEKAAPFLSVLRDGPCSGRSAASRCVVWRQLRGSMEGAYHIGCGGARWEC